MTVSSTVNRVQYTGNGVTVAFSFPYAFFALTEKRFAHQRGAIG